MKTYHVTKRNSSKPDHDHLLLSTPDLLKARRLMATEFLKSKEMGYDMEQLDFNRFIARSVYNKKSWTTYTLSITKED